MDHTQVPPTGTFNIEIGGETFRLEFAADNVTRHTGLAGRKSIDANGGMIFVFPTAAIRYFIMRDYVIPIDIMFLDDAGLVTATYTTRPERQRAAGKTEKAYEQRLHRYYSKSGSQYLIELRAGTIDRLGIKRTDHAMLSTQRIVRGFEKAASSLFRAMRKKTTRHPASVPLEIRICSRPASAQSCCSGLRSRCVGPSISLTVSGQAIRGALPAPGLGKLQHIMRIFLRPMPRTQARASSAIVLR